MKPYYQDKWVTIYHGDCIDILYSLSNMALAVDGAITSPPYNVGLNYGEGTNDKRHDYDKWSNQWLLLLWDLMIPQSRLYLFVGEKVMWQLKPICEKIGWKYHQKLEWCKPNRVGGGKFTCDWDQMTESILLFHKGKRTPMVKVPSINKQNWLRALSTQTNYTGENFRLHPAQFPVEVIAKIVARTPSSVYVDPFLGSGTTAYCAKKLNKKCIGIEIEEKYCEIAAKRCCQEVMELNE